MRWMVTVVVLLSSACLRDKEPESPEAIDASVVGLPDAGAFDPCEWNGLSGYCYGEMGWVSIAGQCRSICGSRRAATSGTVFKTREECNATCSCRREKFVAPDSPTDPFVMDGGCDEVWAVTDGGVELDWPGCRPGARFASANDQECRLDVSPPYDLEDLALICWVSAQPQVRSVVCVAGTQ